jgi:hypothetical protein
MNRYKPFWSMVVAKGVNLISDKESTESDVSEGMAEEFLKEKEIVVEKVYMLYDMYIPNEYVYMCKICVSMYVFYDYNLCTCISIYIYIYIFTYIYICIHRLSRLL